jgi:hypothetical protein
MFGLTVMLMILASFMTARALARRAQAARA